MKQVIVHLSLIEGIGPVAIQRVIERFRDDMSLVYTLDVTDFIQLCGISHLQATKIVAGLSQMHCLEKELSLLEKHQITLVTRYDALYPSILHMIYAPPPVLYIQGTLAETKALAVVGSRNAHEYAQKVTAMLIPPLIENGWMIVSGGALGADTFAHQATLNAQGITCAVLGSGLLHRYPYANNKLFDAIVASGGCLVSSFALQHPPLAGNFPARNRIIAGLSSGCLVVQAAGKSGACITAQFALEQGKEVFVIPGRIDDPLSAGGNALIQQGAKLVADVNDIFTEFNEALISKKCFEQKPQQHSGTELQDPLVILCKQPISLDELADLSKLSFVELQTRLFDLQCEGKLMQNYAGLWHAP